MAASSVAAVSQYCYVGAYNQNQTQFSPSSSTNTVIFQVEMPQAIMARSVFLEFDLEISGAEGDPAAAIRWDSVLGAHGIIQQILTTNFLKGQTIENVTEYADMVKLRLQGMNDQNSLSNSPFTYSGSTWGDAATSEVLNFAVSTMASPGNRLHLCLPLLTGFWMSGRDVPCDATSGFGGIRIQIQLAQFNKAFYTRSTSLSGVTYIMHSPRLFFQKRTPTPNDDIHIFNTTTMFSNNFPSVEMRFEQPLMIQAGLGITVTSVPTSHVNSIDWNSYALCYPGFFSETAIGTLADPYPISTTLFPAPPFYVNYLRGGVSYPIELEQTEETTQVWNVMDALTGSPYLIVDTPTPRTWRNLQPFRNQTLTATGARYSVGGGVSFEGDMLGVIMKLLNWLGPLTTEPSTSSYLRGMMEHRRGLTLPALQFATAE